MRNVRHEPRRERIETMGGQDPGAQPRNWINFQQVEFPFLAAAGGAMPGANLNADVELI